MEFQLLVPVNMYDGLEKKIIEATKVDADYKCIICCEKKSTTKIKINRLAYDDSITSFFVCNECLAKMQRDIEICE